MKNKAILFVISLCALFLALQSVNAQCVDVQSKDTASFMNEIPSLDTQIQSCQPKSPIFLYQNGNFLFNINGAASTSSFTIILKSGKITGITTAISIPAYIITMTESDFDSFLQSTNRMQTYSDLNSAGKIQIKANGIFNTIRLWITNLFSGIVLPHAQTATKQPVGAVCNHGGECATGNCIGIIPGQLYKCSCDPFRYVDADTDGNCPAETQPVPQTKNKAVGELCNHGGECATGNCIGIVPGQVYKCSCNAFRWVAANTDGTCPK